MCTPRRSSRARNAREAAAERSRRRRRSARPRTGAAAPAAARGRRRACAVRPASAVGDERGPVLRRLLGRGEQRPDVGRRATAMNDSGCAMSAVAEAHHATRRELVGVRGRLRRAAPRRERLDLRRHLDRVGLRGDVVVGGATRLDRRRAEPCVRTSRSAPGRSRRTAGRSGAPSRGSRRSRSAARNVSCSRSGCSWYTAIVIVSAVTPWAVAPPLSPPVPRRWTHGGEYENGTATRPVFGVAASGPSRRPRPVRRPRRT